MLPRQLLLDDLVAEVDAFVAATPGPAISFLTCSAISRRRNTSAGRRRHRAASCCSSPANLRPTTITIERAPVGWRPWRISCRLSGLNLRAGFSGHHDLVDQAVLDGLLGGQDLVALDVAADLFDVLAADGR